MKKRSFSSTITIPEGYHLHFKPDNLNFNNLLFELNYSITTTDTIVTVSFDYTWKNAVYAASEYANIKSYFTDIVKKSNEKIVLSK